MTDTNKVVKLIPFQDSEIMGVSFNELTNRVCIEPHGSNALYLYPTDVEAINTVMFPNGKKPVLAELVKFISEQDVELDDPKFNGPLREILRHLGCANDVEFAVSYFEGHNEGWKSYSHGQRRHMLTGFIRGQISRQVTEMLK